MSTAKKPTYKLPFNLGEDPAANLAFFLLENAGSIFGHWKGHILADDQRKLFGQFLGKGSIVIDGDKETITHIKKVCFGLDWDVTFSSGWDKLNLVLVEG